MEDKLKALECALSELAQAFADSSIRRLSDDNITLTDDAAASTIDSGDTAWLQASTALVLFMSIPGLAIYYAGMVRLKNVLATIMQTFSIVCLITFAWICFGYSLAFGPADKLSPKNPFIGDQSRFWLTGMGSEDVHQLASTIPESLFCSYQLTFAIITAALICGSFADRMKFAPMLVFMFLWHIVVYCPIAHWNWHPDGFLFRHGILDFAGGNVVHIASGCAGLMSTLVVGNRKGFGKERFEPHNILLTVMGVSMLWVGWFAFNGGSAVASGARSSMAILVTHISASISGLTWMITEWVIRGQPSVLGMVNGAVAGLVAITPASGYTDINGGFFIGLFGGPVCYFGAQLKHMLGFDDALDAFGVHAIGGIYGGIMTAFFAKSEIYGGHDGILYGNGGGEILASQLYGIVVSAGWSMALTYILLKAIDVTMGLRVSEAEEDEGLDSSLHGESMPGVEMAKGDTEGYAPANSEVVVQEA